jgi:predicted homoserine dehydrogenase-like protein
MRQYAPFWAEADGLLPLGLAEGGTVHRAVRAGEPLAADGVETRPSTIGHLRALHDRQLAGN